MRRALRKKNGMMSMVSEMCLTADITEGVMLTGASVDSVFNRRALQEYILIAGQHTAGGLRDKPPKSVPFSHLFCLFTLVRSLMLSFCGMQERRLVSHALLSLRSLSRSAPSFSLEREEGRVEGDMDRS